MDSEAEIAAEVARLRRGIGVTVTYRLHRVFVRIARLFAGCCIGALGVWAALHVYEEFGKPLVSLTLGDIAVVLTCGWLTFSCVVGSFHMAFGPAPTDDDHFRTLARQILVERAKAEGKRAKARAIYARSKLLGILHDPDHGFPDRPVMRMLVRLAAVTVALVAIPLLVALALLIGRAFR